MEDQVPFKVYTQWQEGDKPEVRRFGVDKSVVTNYNYLHAKILEVFPRLKEKTFSISWKDEDGDDVKMSSDEEVLTMLTALNENVVKLFVQVHVSGRSTEIDIPIRVSFAEHPEATVTPQADLHFGVCCDGCNRRVAGFRYKCITCEDFDLCSQCESQRVHSEHCVVRIPSPNMSLLVIKESIKKSRHFLKSVASNIHEAKKQKYAEKKAGGGCLNPGMVPIPNCGVMPADLKHALAKERRGERREERQEKRQERQERREEERRERRECSHEPRSGWIDVFSKYVDQFANLAADHIRVAGTAAGESRRSHAAGEPPRPSTTPLLDEMLRHPYGLDPEETDKAMRMCKTYEEECVVLQQMLSKLDSRFQNSNGNAQASTSQPAGTASASTGTASAAATATAPAAATATISAATAVGPTATIDTATATAATFASAAATAAASASASAPATAPAGAVAPAAATAPVSTISQPPLAPPTMPIIQPEEDKVDAKSDAASLSSVGSVSRDSSPDKGAEEWTMINQDKEFEVDGAGAIHVPIENLPAEFQLRSGLAYEQLYPPLNEATAVHDPKKAAAAPAKVEPVPVPQAAAPGPQPRAPTTSGLRPGAPPGSPQTQGQASAPPTWKFPATEEHHHRVPHIDAAIRQMISMGFTNEGGWLTQLLESKDGNIAAVLDLLTPVNPHKK